MKNFEMDKQEIRQAAISFKEALMNWKSLDSIRESSKIHHPDWDDEDILRSAEYEARIVDPVLKFLEPLYRLALRGEIDRPFNFYNTYVARIMNDHLGWPETLHPYWRFKKSLKGGLSETELNELFSYNEYESLDSYKRVVKEIQEEGWTPKTDK